MTATQTQLRRGTAAQCDAMTPAEAEPIVDLTNDRLRIGDGVKAGGFPIPNGYDIQQAAMNFAVAGGSANALTLTVYPVPPGYAQPMNLRFRATSTNTGATTIDVNGLGAKNIYKWSSGSLVALSGGDLRSGGIYEISYDGVQFQLMNAPVASIVSVGQGDLRTSTGSVGGSVPTGNYIVGAFASVVGSLAQRMTVSSVNGVNPQPAPWSPSLLTMPGGQYGFAPLGQGSGNSYSFLQRYITSSPPFDLGDGEVGGFIFLKISSNGEIIQKYIADVPPWAYNGPTDIRASHKCPITGKKFRKVIKNRTFEQIMDGAKIEYELQEITQDLKNKDMALIPHPFAEVPAGHTVVLLDPMSDKVARMIEAQNNGMADDVSNLIASNKIKIDSDNIKRGCPKGVKPCKFRLSK